MLGVLFASALSFHLDVIPFENWCLKQIERFLQPEISLSLTFDYSRSLGTRLD